ncbi:hypothetical protein Cflav_PD1250 [Pedosphaera parvula Ellin514]|uniref:Uncharacterized protein n=1 Tax=Pedosphaera parvula (strain Ellin514) TaxID=320771 RepID=B9XNV0_PEDPL|nr:hypothetical protein Cflav_PD1250 [Pedosphaera parvula Ellin514]
MSYFKAILAAWMRYVYTSLARTLPNSRNRFILFINTSSKTLLPLSTADISCSFQIKWHCAENTLALHTLCCKMTSL